MLSTQEMLRNEAQQQAGMPLDQEAVVAIQETQKAVDAINRSKTDEALAAIEHASGKIDILLARHPDRALIPVDREVAIFDTAPEDIDAIRDIGAAVDGAVDLNNYPSARALLYGLMSEIRTRTRNLPLASYPSALSTAARFLQEKKIDDAVSLLTIALNTLVVTDRLIPIPMLLAREELSEAQSQSDKDKQNATRLVESARQDLQRAKELGYAINDPDYQTLNDQLSDLRKELKNNQDTTSLFGRIRERMASLLKRQSQHDYSQGRAHDHARAQDEETTTKEKQVA